MGVDHGRPLRTAKRVPKGARLAWADALSSALKEVADHPEQEWLWRKLFALPKLCRGSLLGQPRSNRRKSLK